MNFKLNSKRLFNKSRVKRGYSTSSSSNSIKMSEKTMNSRRYIS